MLAVMIVVKLDYERKILININQFNSLMHGTKVNKNFKAKKIKKITNKNEHKIGEKRLWKWT